MRKIVFDCSRLIRRLDAKTPTGIDRVDFRYLHFFLGKKSRFELHAIAMKSGRFCLLDEKLVVALHAALERNWYSSIDEGTVDAAPRMTAQKTKSAISRHMRRARLYQTVRSLRHGRRQPSDEVRAILSDDNTPMYVNTSHLGLDRQSSILALKHALSAQVVVFIHDLIPIQYPQFVRTGHDEIHESRLKTVSAAADTVIVNSSATKLDLRDYLTSRNLRCPEIHTLSIGVEEHFIGAASAGRDTSSTDPYFVVLGTIEPRKNHCLLLKVWSEILAAQGSAPRLLVVGKRGWDNQKTLSWLDKLERLGPFVSELPEVPDRDLIGILKHANALLMPSFAEGWGMPVVEALTLGVSVIASDIAAHREASDGAATLLDPDDESGWKQAIIENWLAVGSSAKDGERRTFTPPTWDDHFRKFEHTTSGPEE